MKKEDRFLLKIVRLKEAINAANKRIDSLEERLSALEAAEE